MRPIPADTTLASTDGDQSTDATAALAQAVARIAAELAACEALGDPELARHTGRKLLAVVAGAADSILRDGGQALQAAPDKFGAFFDKAAAGYVQAIDGLAKRTALADGMGNGTASVRPRAADAALEFPPWCRVARE